MTQDQSLALSASSAKGVARIAQGQARSGRVIPHWGISEIARLVKAAGDGGKGRNAQRDPLLILTLFDAALRVSEGLGLRPVDIVRTEDGYRLRVNGKTGYREVACSPSLIGRLQGYAYEHSLAKDNYFFPLTRTRVWKIVNGAMTRAGLTKPPGVGAVHLLRHSGAIERMRATGNPRSVQDQLGHASAGMTMRYWRTLNSEESIKIQESVDFGWR